MRAIKSDSFDDIYKESLAILLSNLSSPIESTKGRNIEINNISMQLTDINSYAIDFKSTLKPQRQKIYSNYLEKELDWYFRRGVFQKHSDELHFNSSPCPKEWKKYADENGKIVSNYGHIILRQKQMYGRKKRQHRRKTPFQFCVELLLEKPLTRQAMLHYNLPKHFNNKAKDIPCTVSAQVFIRENKLHMTVFQRSSDVFTGLPYDVPWHCELIKHMVKEIKNKVSSKNTDKNLSNLTAGTLTLFISSLHLYDNNFKQAILINQNTSTVAA